MDTREIFFPMPGTRYKIRGGPDLNQLINSLKPENKDKPVTFTFIAHEGDALLVQDVPVQVHGIVNADNSEAIFTVSASVVTDNGMDLRMKIGHYDTRDQRGTDAGVFM